MIPKVIHYCWFGFSEKSGLITDCINSWKKNLPDYEIVEWNETNFDINSNEYVRQAYAAKKWAFVSDYVRLYALYNYGGIYFDTDVEVLKNFDVFLKNDAFNGFETNDSLVTAVMGSMKGHPIFKEFLSHYEELNFINGNGEMNLTTNTHTISDYLLANGIKTNGKEQQIKGFKVYPAIYFSPNNISRIWNHPSKKSYAIHYFDQSWKDEKRNENTLSGRIRRYMVGVARNLFGTYKLESFRDKYFNKDK